MDFLEKDLETIIWENYEACLTRGLDINQPDFIGGQGYRQMNLMPYGIADMVFIYYFPAHNRYNIQIIELKRGKVDTAAYLQAKRYQTALASIIDASGRDSEIDFQLVLVGNEVETAGDFVFALNADASCRAFVYKYTFDGIQFTNAGKEWRISGAKESAQFLKVSNELEEYASEEFAKYVDKCDGAWLREQERLDYSNALLITSDGVLLNEYLLALPEGDTDGAQ